ncbi:MAG TPA: HlyD family efflux transporter periplasmic adaptor subunit [Bacteroidales bacterium]|jgi:HlyD family secretion protein|nr:HlyD family efflux transporter periplasmic adaptor subunit [Bacteroidota bacterium]MZQ78480.1 HlyD family efflux transporter periplasmic adaptor subunit [Bacteroidales bacterium]HOE25242.1 HlyD family efflux transporter periplasmic adaptor subunit [Bacteroidales bacterium]HOH14215.1 HlyD family efflux transporter periplasmic adaptor subunit [Bacteroidales bacterium]HOR10019.1 HlyD family efflux transporter periplasmic adaptor subunit [Bacteroidales bacterium]
MKRAVIPIVLLLAAAGCHRGESDADAWGTFMADEVIISAETSGRIISMDVTEGMLVAGGAVIAVTDTTMAVLQRGELDAVTAQAQARLAGIAAQDAVIRQQMDNLSVNIERTRRMLADGAATRKQLDDLTGQMEVLRLQAEANATQRRSVAAEQQGITAKRAVLDEQIARSTVCAPCEATVIEKYASAHELTSAGKPLVKLANMNTMKLKVWVSGAQLAEVKTGTTCTVRIDQGKKEFKNYTGTITHISEKAEFTPKIIQTKEERVTLVYAVTIEVQNDGSIKSGMPGEAIFN